jgi:ribosomal protein S10
MLQVTISTTSENLTRINSQVQVWKISQFCCGNIKLHTNYFCNKWKKEQAFPRGQVIVPQESITVETSKKEFQNYASNELWEIKIHSFDVEITFSDGEVIIIPMEYTEKVNKISQKMADWCTEALESPMLIQTGENTYSYQ